MNKSIVVNDDDVNLIHIIIISYLVLLDIVINERV